MLFCFYEVDLDALDTEFHGLLPLGFYVSFVIYKVGSCRHQHPVIRRSPCYVSCVATCEGCLEVLKERMAAVGKSYVCVVMISPVI
jgi:hypothetical protein